MLTSHNLTQFLLSLAVVSLLAMSALAADPGVPVGNLTVPPLGADSDSPGNVLVYNLYASSATNPVAENTRISVTNVADNQDVSVHFYFIDGSTCSVADSYVCLTRNQTVTMYASDIDPGVRGYIIAMVTSELGGLSLAGRITGNAYVKLASGHAALLNAQALVGSTLTISDAGDFGIAVQLRVPRVLALPNLPSPADANNTLLVVNRLGGDLRLKMNNIGNLFGILYDSLENPYSWTGSGGCQLLIPLNNTFPRTSPRLSSVIPAGAVGWMKFWSASASDWDRNGDNDTDTPGRGITGAYLNYNPGTASSATAFNGGANLTQTSLNGYLSMPADPDDVDGEIIIFPIFPSNCDFSDVP